VGSSSVSVANLGKTVVLRWCLSFYQTVSQLRATPRANSEKLELAPLDTSLAIDTNLAKIEVSDTTSCVQKETSECIGGGWAKSAAGPEKMDEREQRSSGTVRGMFARGPADRANRRVALNCVGSLLTLRGNCGTSAD
jgi:hypothetical protein